MYNLLESMEASVGLHVDVFPQRCESLSKLAAPFCTPLFKATVGNHMGNSTPYNHATKKLRACHAIERI